MLRGCVIDPVGPTQRAPHALRPAHSAGTPHSSTSQSFWAPTSSTHSSYDRSAPLPIKRGGGEHSWRRGLGQARAQCRRGSRRRRRRRRRRSCASPPLPIPLAQTRPWPHFLGCVRVCVAISWPAVYASCAHEGDAPRCGLAWHCRLCTLAPASPPDFTPISITPPWAHCTLTTLSLMFLPTHPVQGRPCCDAPTPPARRCSRSGRR